MNVELPGSGGCVSQRCRRAWRSAKVSVIGDTSVSGLESIIFLLNSSIAICVLGPKSPTASSIAFVRSNRGSIFKSNTEVHCSDNLSKAVFSKFPEFSEFPDFRSSSRSRFPKFSSFSVTSEAPELVAEARLESSEFRRLDSPTILESSEFKSTETLESSEFRSPEIFESREFRRFSMSPSEVSNFCEIPAVFWLPAEAEAACNWSNRSSMSPNCLLNSSRSPALSSTSRRKACISSCIADACGSLLSRSRFLAPFSSSRIAAKFSSILS
mmetsp:Transcript_19811/g.42380  ORF Transcript_19811/g.42380 Transcript_19811/m.42380 type:complete len:270 (-) Transcript_19811:1284-2093(-)